MLIFEEFFKTKSDQNIHQTHQTAQYIQNFLGGASTMLLNPLLYACNKIISKYTPKRINLQSFFFEKKIYFHMRKTQQKNYVQKAE